MHPSGSYQFGKSDKQTERTTPTARERMAQQTAPAPAPAPTRVKLSFEDFKPFMQATATIIKENAELTDDKLAAIRKELEDQLKSVLERLNGVDGTAVLKSTAMLILKANVAELRRIVDDATLRKSAVIDPEGLPSFAKMALEGRAGRA